MASKGNCPVSCGEIATKRGSRWPPHFRGSGHDGMLSTSSKRTVLLWILLVNGVLVVEGARGGGRGGGKQRGRGRLYHSRIIPAIIQHRNNDNYYEHKDGARIVQASHFEQDYMLGRKISFFCMAIGLPRPEITWFKDGVELYYHKFFQLHEWPIGNDTMKSKMEIDPTTQQDAGYYECQANNQYAIDIRGFRTDYVMITY